MALANKNLRTAWALLTQEVDYEDKAAWLTTTSFLAARAANGCADRVNTMAGQVGPAPCEPEVDPGLRDRCRDEAGASEIHRGPGTFVPNARPDTWLQLTLSTFVPLLR